ncbi:IS256 family transposase [Desulfovibrio inopinatus]|uniref:IS256 family transposase n=1 Tax=Desulfovibrio inopinatus TaxID=102109 RepID=UPI0003F8455D|nr:IS256 family transposase [Desulfovibrio inopinatus]
MSKDSISIFEEQAAKRDMLTELARQGAMQILAQALEIEVQELLERVAQPLADGKKGVVRNGYLPERDILTGAGPVPVKVPKVRDRTGNGIKFTSKLVPPYLKRTESIEDFLPLLYLHGISTGDFKKVLTALFGDKAQGLSSSSIGRLKQQWQDEHQEWNKRSLKGHHYIYIWADGVYFNIRADDDRQCILVVIGATTDGRKELLAVEDGFRESEQSWYELLVDLKTRGLEIPPSLAIADGALGFWAALRKLFPGTKQQRCWVHKTANVLNKLPKSIQKKAKAGLHEIWMAATHEEANKAFDLFLKKYEAKYPKAAQCLKKDREELLIFYDFPAEHWAHIRTTNPIESTFATVRLRTSKTRGCVSRDTIRAMVFKLVQSAQQSWRRLRGYKLLDKLITGTKFVNGEEVLAEDMDESGREAA